MRENLKEETAAITCPVCRSNNNETAKFCSECGTKLGKPAFNPIWTAVMHQSIAHAKDNDLYFTIFAVLGAITAIAIPFVMRFVLLYNMDILSWTLTIVGIVFFIAAYIGMFLNEKKYNRLVQQMAGGPENEHGGDIDPAWITAMHESIDHAKDNAIYFTVLAVLGAITVIVIPFVMRFVLLYTLDPLSWGLVIIGIIFFIAGCTGIIFSDRKQKKLIVELGLGPEEPEAEEPEDII